MEHVKVFYTNDIRDNAPSLEMNINKWLDFMGNDIEITRTTHAASGRMAHHVSVMIFYKPKKS
jgi:D-ribose pyranose/furanose isomerase RbsD